jgi:hypothetical protein
LKVSKGIILIKTANAVAAFFSNRHTIDKKWDFFGKTEIFESGTRIGKRTEWHATAFNEHIGSMAALPPLERSVRKASLSPAGTHLEAATAPICHHVICHFGTVRWAREIYDKFRQNYRKLKKSEN